MDVKLFQAESILQIGKRKNQEDSIYPRRGEATEETRCFVLCDGMGGLDRGEVASSVVSSVLGQAINERLAHDGMLTDAAFEDALDKAYDALDAKSDVGHTRNMGTTLALLCFHRGGCLAAHIGDSRIYHLRPKNDEIMYRSRDHSLVYQLFEQGELSVDEVRTFPRRNVILRAMQPLQKTRTVADLVHIRDIAAGDYFVIGSDGIFEQLEDKVLMGILKSDAADKQKRERLEQLTTNNNDNHSAYIIHVKGVEHEPGDKEYPDDERAARDTNKLLLAEANDVEVVMVGNDNQHAEMTAEEANINLNPTKLKSSGQKLSWLIAVMAVLMLIAAAIFLGLQYVK